MGIDVRIEKEKGQALEWATGSLPKSLGLGKQLYSSTEFPLTGSIDPYGDTVFNRLQASQLLHEWSVLTARVEESDRRVMEEVARLVEKCRDGVHL